LHGKYKKIKSNSESRPSSAAALGMCSSWEKYEKSFSAFATLRHGTALLIIIRSLRDRYGNSKSYFNVLQSFSFIFHHRWQKKCSLIDFGSSLMMMIAKKVTRFIIIVTTAAKDIT
jgi:hypothetical protein